MLLQARRAFLMSIGTSPFTAAAMLASPAAADAPCPPLRLGQIGVGHGHANKLAIYRDSPDWEVVGICEPDAGLRAAAEKQKTYQGLPWMSRDELLALDGLDAVLVETKPDASLKHAAAAIAAGRHVHLDKPAGTSLPAYRKLLEDANAKGLVVQMGYMFRFNPAVMLLREFLEQGWLGDVFEVSAVMSKVVEPAARKEFARFPGGMMFELGCHVIDLVVAVLGKPDRVESVLRHSLENADDTLADNTLAILHYPRTIATVRASALEVEGFSRRHLTVCGTEGTFHIQPLDDPSVRITLDRPRGMFPKGITEVPFPGFTRYIADAAEMAAMIRGEKASPFTPDHDLAVQETVLLAGGMPIDG